LSKNNKNYFLKLGDLVMTFLADSKDCVRAKILNIIKDELDEVTDLDCDLIDHGILKTVRSEE
jgi:hypothetical protein